jgi:hypothetical protein
LVSVVSVLWAGEGALRQELDHARHCPGEVTFDGS